jgi:hypothetical protein
MLALTITIIGAMIRAVQVVILTISARSDGYSNWWHQADQQNTGIQQGQLSNVNVKGNDNRVTVNQGQSVQGGGDTSGGRGRMLSLPFSHSKMIRICYPFLLDHLFVYSRLVHG